MKVTKLLAFFITLSIPFSSFSQDLFAYSDNVSNSIEKAYTSKESIKAQEYKLVSKLNNFLVHSIEYPYEARENGDEGTVRGVVLISPDHSKASLKMAKGNSEHLETALIEAFNKLDISKLISDSYEGRQAIPIKINFELD